MPKTIIISIHDISPKYEEEIYKILESLEKLGVKKKDLHIVLNFQNRYRIDESNKLLKLLKRDISKGSLPAFHGIIHYKNERNFINHLLFGEEYSFVSEFSHLRKSEIRETIRNGKKIYKNLLGVYPKLMIPARWDASQYMEDACKEEGMEYCEKRGEIINIKKMIRKKSPICNFDFGDNLVLNKISRLYAYISIFRSKIMNEPLRYCIHPNDLKNNNFFFEIKLLKKLINNGWQPVTTSEFWDLEKSK